MSYISVALVQTSVKSRTEENDFKVTLEENLLSKETDCVTYDVLKQDNFKLYEIEAQAFRLFISYREMNTPAQIANLQEVGCRCFEDLPNQCDLKQAAATASAGFCSLRSHS